MEQKMTENNGKRIVIKVGTSTLTHKTGRLNIRRVEKLIKTIADLQNAGNQLIMVSSGAIGLGMSKLGMTQRPKDTPTKQACAAVGQCELMDMYDRAFSQYGITVAQLLLTKYVLLEDRRRNVENAMARLIELGVIPIVNENDTVAIDELVLQVGENDSLAAIVAEVAKADMLVIMSDIDGLYSDDPRKNKDAKFIHLVEHLTEEYESMAKESTGSNVGTGGMNTKLIAAKIATKSGADMIIANSKDVKILDRLIAGSEEGILFLGNKDVNFNIKDFMK